MLSPFRFSVYDHLLRELSTFITFIIIYQMQGLFQNLKFQKPYINNTCKRKNQISSIHSRSFV